MQPKASYFNACFFHLQEPADFLLLAASLVKLSQHAYHVSGDISLKSKLIKIYLSELKFSNRPMETVHMADEKNSINTHQGIASPHEDLITSLKFSEIKTAHHMEGFDLDIRVFPLRLRVVEIGRDTEFNNYAR